PDQVGVELALVLRQPPQGAGLFRGARGTGRVEQQIEFGEQPGLRGGLLGHGPSLVTVVVSTGGCAGSTTGRASRCRCRWCSSRWSWRRACSNWVRVTTPTNRVGSDRSTTGALVVLCTAKALTTSRSVWSA